MSEHDEVGTRLAAALHAEADRTTPEPGLQLILSRTRPAPARSAVRRWWPAVVGAVAAAALIAVALTSTGGSGSPPQLPVADQPMRPVAVYVLHFEAGAAWDDARLFSDEVEAHDTGDPGVDAVNALMTTIPSDPDYTNTWASLGPNDEDSLELVAPVSVRSVVEADGVVYVDFTGPVDNPWQGDVDWAVNPDFFTQQLVWTVQDALHTQAPLLVTIDGKRVDGLLTAPVHNPIARDPSILAPVQIESPAQGETVASPVTVSGLSATFEGNVVWRVKHDGKVVARGNVQSQGANGVFGPFEFTVGLAPGDYTVEAYEESAENGDIINLDSKDFIVEPGRTTSTVAPGDKVQLAVYYVSPAGELVSGGFTVTSTGDLGRDAVQALLTGRQDGFGNAWSGLLNQPEQVAKLRSVTHQDGQVTVDFDRNLTGSASLEQEASFGELTVQQLVHTVQSALRTADPVLITVDGEPADTAFGVPLDGPVAADWSVVSGIRPQTPAQGATVSSPVEVTGESTTFEGNIVWQVERDGGVVDHGVTMGGANGEYAPYSFAVDLAPGDYMLKLWEGNPAGGREGLAPELSVVYVDFTVE